MWKTLLLIVVVLVAGVLAAAVMRPDDFKDFEQGLANLKAAAEK